MDIENFKVKMQKLAEFLKPLIRKIIKLWNLFKEKVPKAQANYFKKQEHIRKVKASWYTRKDNRRKHQVLNNKPKCLVRKII